MQPEQSLAELAVNFPAGVYADVRFERTTAHRVILRDGVLEDVQSTSETGALIRVHKNGSWLIASTTDLPDVPTILARLAASEAAPRGEGPSGIEHLQVHQAQRLVFEDERIDRVPLQDKLAFLRRFLGVLDRPAIKTWGARWLDQHRERRFVSSKGADVHHDYQEGGVILSFAMGEGANTVTESFRTADHRFSDLLAGQAEAVAALSARLDKCERFAADAVPVEAGPATVILAPEAAGIFAHESFGHKSEADFMLGDPAMMDEWKIGTRVAADGVSITDGGHGLGSGYMPFDDEGQPTETTHLIKDGMLAGRLHSSMTAAALGERPTGNARAISFRFEPIVRMTNTMVEAGSTTKAELFAAVDDGYFIETVRHGSGMSTFTIAPGLCWRIRDGELHEPVRIAVMTGTVFETMGEIDGLSDEVEVPFLVGGGCGKMEQWPLSVGFGGPHVRVRRMNLA